MPLTRTIAAAVLAAITTSPVHAEWEIRGNVSLQAQAFTKDPQHTADHSSNFSLSAESEFYHVLGDNGSVTITPFARIDQQDDERSHIDLRELFYDYSTDAFDLKVGLGKVFWGVAESVNLVDVINQSDLVEGVTDNEKLGQPMINLLLSRDWGDLDLYVLPGFRERTFPGKDGRPRFPVVVDTDNPLYESDDENRHIDVAARFSRQLGDWDFGVHGFHGTSRNPVLQFNPASLQPQPFYYQISQAGVDAQATLESWLLKAEVIYQTGDQIDDHSALVTGFEYSFYGILETDTDLGIVTEWLYDDRGDEAMQPFQNDVLIGLRFALNDEQSSDALVGVIADLDGGGQLLSLEASRRLGNSYRLSLDASFWLDTDEDPPLLAFEGEDFLQLELGYFF